MDASKKAKYNSYPEWIEHLIALNFSQDETRMNDTSQSGTVRGIETTV